jgi:hypothetical protein
LIGDTSYLLCTASADFHNRAALGLVEKTCLGQKVKGVEDCLFLVDSQNDA